MKFLCDNCKAKYQISDDKVAGKTVRMKCRKCGHQIEVRAAVTETSVSAPPPKADPPKAPGAPGSAPSALGGSPGAPAAPKRPGLATSLSAARPQTQKMAQPTGGALAGAFAKSVKEDGSPQSMRPGSAPLSQSQPPISALDALDVSMTDEWYVAINGVPVGPVRVSELRRKAGGGAVTEDSLCWQEGLEEWRPIKSIPELARIVREAASSGRPSLTANSERISATPPPPQGGGGGMAGQRPAAPRPQTGAPPAPRPMQTGGVLPAAARSNVVPFAGRLATAEKIDEAVLAPIMAPLQEPPIPITDPFGTVNMMSPPAAQAVTNGTGQAFAVPQLAPPQGLSSPQLPQGLAAPPHISVAPSSVVAVPQRRGVPIWAMATMAFAGCFGIAVAIMVFMPKQQPPAQPLVIQVPTPVAATATAAPDPNAATSASPVASGDTPAGSASAGAKIAANGAPKTATGATPPPSATHTGADLSSLLGGGPGGPNTGPGGAGGGGAGGGLDANAVQTVVRNRAPGVKRKCWDSGTNDQKTSANVLVAVTVAPNGSVQNATATGDDPVISACIAREVKSWSFPAPGSTTTVNIPFHFVRQ